MIKKHTKINELINNKDFITLFDSELIKYIDKIIKDVYQKHKALKNLYLNNVLTFDNFKNCYSNNDILKIWKNGRFAWPDDCVNFFKGYHSKGKLRPEHSEKMKIKMKGINRGDSFRETKKIQNSSINFKIKFLNNKNIDTTLKTEDEINKLYGLTISDLRKSKQYKIKKVKNFLKSNKYLNETIFLNFKNEINDINICDENINTIHTKMMSIISTISMNRNENMGSTKFFKTGFIKVKNCLNKSIIRYRSSWEFKTIEFLELNNIIYSYEPFYIEKENGTLYLPDFLIEYNGEKILLEIKGFIRGVKGKLNEEMKINAAKKYCNENKIRYVYLKKVLTNINEIIK
jgi:hypothetical protein